jgi:glycine/D-amino acid oxidase-like deaminating enzyme
VLGAGVVGATVAYRLSRAGLRVTVLEAQRPAALASRRSFAWINSSDKPPRPYHDLNAAGVAEYGALAAELGGDWLHRAGRLEWASEPARRAALRDKVARLQTWDYAAELVTRAEAAAIAPGLRLPGDGDAEYAFYAEEGWVEAADLIARLLAGVEAAGGAVRYPAPAERLALAGGRVDGVAAAGTTYAADTVVDCTGVAAGALLAPHGLRLAQRRSPGLLIVTEAAPVTLDRVVHAPGVYLRPDGNGRLLIGSEEIDARLADLAPDAPTPAPLDEPCQELLRRGRAVASGLAGVEIESTRLCWRPMPADGLSAVGPVPALPGYYLALTHSGVTLAPVLGRLVADELATGRPAPPLAPFRPERLLGDA